MRKILLFLTLFLFSSILSFATHNLGGYISYKHISGYTYEITVVTYSTLQSITADRCELVVSFGDGVQETISRSNGSSCVISGQITCNHCGTDMDGIHKRNEYVVQHTYPSPNSYLIHMTDPNRNQGIINIPNSVQIPFYLESELVILSNNFQNSAPELLSLPIINVVEGTIIHQNLTVVDRDGDILSYELVPTKGDLGIDIPGGTIPAEVTIDKVNGELIWDKMSLSGAYIITVKVNQCRNNMDIGFVLIDLQVLVSNSLSQLKFSGLSSLPTDYFNRYSVVIGPNDSIDLDLTFEDTYLHSSVNLEAVGESFYSSDPSSFSLVNNSQNSITKKFKWKHNPVNIRCAPYVISFNGESNTTNHIFKEALTLMVYVQDQSFSNCGSVCGGILSNNTVGLSQELEISVFPNPVISSTRFTIIGADKEDFTFNLYDIQGRRVQCISHVKQTEFVVDRNGLSEGFYFYEVIDSTGKKGTGKIIIVD